MEKTTKFKNIYFVFYVFLFAFGMLGLSFASVPLYDLFCRVTGYAGTTQKASLAPGPKVDGSLLRNEAIENSKTISQFKSKL